MARRTLDPADAELVNRFLNEAIRELWEGNIRVRYNTFESITHSFFHRGIFVEVIDRGRDVRWVQVENENIDDLGAPPGMFERLYEAVSAPERRYRGWTRITKAEARAIRASWHGYHKRGLTGAEKLVRQAMAA